MAEQAHTAGQRCEFELADDDRQKILEASRPVILIALQCGMPSSPQENANRAWCALGDRKGFDGMTVLASPRGPQFFTAIARATGTSP